MSARIALVVFATVALTGCATSRPYAEISGEKINHANPHEEDVFIMAIDGRLDLTRPKTALVEPGQRQLILQSVRQVKVTNKSGADVPLNAKPCLRYRFVARHESITHVTPWALVLANVEPIPECISRFPEHAPVPAKPAA
jgi:hypothetical protein